MTRWVNWLSWIICPFLHPELCSSRASVLSPRNTRFRSHFTRGGIIASWQRLRFGFFLLKERWQEITWVISFHLILSLMCVSEWFPQLFLEVLRAVKNLLAEQYGLDPNNIKGIVTELQLHAITTGVAAWMSHDCCRLCHHFGLKDLKDLDRDLDTSFV